MEQNTLVGQIAKHFRAVHFGGNWTAVNLKDTLADLTWQEATTQVHHLNTIAALVFHINYYVHPVLNVLQGEALYASDRQSFELIPIASAQDWERLVDKTFTEAKRLACQIEQFAEQKLFEDFADSQYGHYYRNLHGMVEHIHYHLGQIVLLKKILREENFPVTAIVPPAR